MCMMMNTNNEKKMRFLRNSVHFHISLLRITCNVTCNANTTQRHRNKAGFTIRSIFLPSVGLEASSYRLSLGAKCGALYSICWSLSLSLSKELLDRCPFPSFFPLAPFSLSWCVVVQGGETSYRAIEGGRLFNSTMSS
jgi:hypothetical protein